MPNEPKPKDLRLSLELPLQNFLRAFEEVFKQAGRQEWIRQKSQQPINIVDVGVGAYAEEFTPLYLLFPQANFRGIDNDSIFFPLGAKLLVLREIKKIVDEKELPAIGERIEFIKKDGAKSEAYGNKKYDLFIIRNPNILSSNWDKVIDESMNHITKQGLMFITSNSRSEFNAMKKLLEKNAQVNILYADSNPSSFRTSKHFQETHIILANKIEQDSQPD